MPEKHYFFIREKESIFNSEIHKWTFSQITKINNWTGGIFLKLRLDSKDDQLELMLHIKDLFDDGIIRTKDISENIGRSERQTRRYLVQMAGQKLISFTDSKRLVKS